MTRHWRSPVVTLPTSRWPADREEIALDRPAARSPRWLLEKRRLTADEAIPGC